MAVHNRPHASGNPEPRRRRGRALVAAIHDAVLRETAERGVPGLTMEGVARRAGTAKTSLYRRWDDPREILLEAMYEAFPQEEPSVGSGDLRADLIQSLVLLRDFTNSTPLGQALLSVMTEAERDGGFRRRVYAEIFDARGGRFTRTVLTHYAERGQIDPARVTPVTTDVGEAMVFKYALDHQEAPDDAYLAAVVDQVLLPAVGRDPR